MKHPQWTVIIPLFLSVCYVRCSLKATDISRPNYPSWRHRKGLTPVTGLFFITIASPCTGRYMLYTHPARIINTKPSAPPNTKCLLYTHAHARIGRHAVCQTRNLTLQEWYKSPIFSVQQHITTGALYKEWSSWKMRSNVIPNNPLLQ